MFYVFSTLTSPTAYCIYPKGQSKDVGIPEKRILICGGNGVATKHLFTPKGVMTEVSDADMELLNADVNFQNHVKKGFIKVEKKRAEPEKVAKDMAQKDKSAPLTPDDYIENAESSTYKTKKPKGQML